MSTRSSKRANHPRGISNIYADLGYRAPETMHVQAQLAGRITELPAERGLTQTEAAGLPGIPEPKLPKMFRSQIRALSLFGLLKCFTHLGYDVHITIRPRPNKRSPGTLSVTFA